MPNTSRSLVRSSTGRFARKARTSTTEATATTSSRALRGRTTNNNNDESLEPPLKRLRTDGPKSAKTRSSLSSSSSDLISPSSLPRPPTKVTVTQPHGGLLQTTNGVQTVLDIREDKLPLQIPTPSTNGSYTSKGESRSGASNQEKRTLRSQDGGSRLKSDLAIYFPNYDDIITDAPKEPEFLSIGSPIYIIDEPLKTSQTDAPTHSAHKTHSSPQRSRAASFHTPRSSINGTHNVNFSPKPTKPHLNGAQIIDFSAISRHSTHTSADPLSDSVYFKPHRRAERKEKQLRNIEKERAMHEKVQLERLLDGLLGHDWLRVMGITGITDSERKEWEPKRAYFVREVKALVDKFRVWKEEEKRLRVEKEQATLAKEEEDEEEGAEEDESGEVDGDPLNSSDLDDSAARQLHQEASSASKAHKPRARQKLLLLRPPSPDLAFTSFYAKPHLRAAALGKHRHGRTVTAFGQPVPDFVEHEFRLPDEWLTPDVLRANARKRRRMKRESKG